MANISIRSEGGVTDITVDGKPLPGVMAATVAFASNALPVVALDICAVSNAMDLTGAVVTINGLDVGEAIEKALLAYLQAKYLNKEG